jgi:hypothetical protein
VRIGIAHHLGWAVAVTIDDDHEVRDRRRIELIEPGLPVAPIHHEGGPWEEHRTGPELDDEALAALVREVLAGTRRATAAALDELVAVLDAPVSSLSVAAWPEAFPTELSVLRRVPHEAKADSIRYRQVLAEAATERGWAVHRFEPRTVEAQAVALLGPRAEDVLHGPRRRLGPPWAKDHRLAVAAAVVAGVAGVAGAAGVDRASS